MVFAAAVGQKAETVKKVRVPLGRGVAGLVAATGQPMAVSDAQSDARHAAEIAEHIGYRPQTILCVPLLHDEEVIGVLELLDKEGAASFGPVDMSTLTLFAEQAAVAIQQSRTQRMLADLLGDALVALGHVSADKRKLIHAQVRSFTEDIDADPTFRLSLELAQLIREIAHQGEAELQMCITILSSIATTARSRQHTLAGFAPQPKSAHARRGESRSS